MKKISFNFLCLLLLVSFFKELLFMSIVPIWHAPDEQAHFAQVANYAEGGVDPQSGIDLNREIYESEEDLGTLRNIQGNNKFTYHPDYRIDYTSTVTGKYEKYINSQPLAARKELVKQEAANYPPLYYWIGSLFYKLFYFNGLIDRVFAVRFFSLLIGITTVFVAYLLGKEIFPKDKLLQISLPTLISFHPMLSFVSIGVTSDVLTNFLFTVLIYWNVYLIIHGIKKSIIIYTLLTIFALYLTKPQFLLAIPIFLLALILSLFIHVKNKKVIFLSVISSISLLGVLLVSFVLFPSFATLIQKLYPQSFFPGQVTHLASPGDFLKVTLNRIAHETVPWYFGVFDWLGVVFPLPILRAINRILIIVGLGLIWKLILVIKNKKKEDGPFLYLIGVSLIYFVGIIFYDYLFFSTHNFSFGLQGRYFFPTIVAHMALLLIGFSQLFSFKLEKFKKIGVKIFVLLMISLNIFTFWLLSYTYYDVTSIQSFIIQMSQYKPGILKGNVLEFLLFMYIAGLIFFVSIFILKKESKDSGKQGKFNKVK